MRFGEAISHLLNDCGVETVFGIPGVHTIELYRDIHTTGITPIVPRHEQGAGFMADGYARSTGRPGVCYLVSGPGLLNAMTPIAQAWHDSIPMLIISSAPEMAGRGPSQLHALPDQAGIVGQLTSISEEVTDPDHFSELIGRAFESWRTSRPRPVHLTVPVDCLSRETGALSLPSMNSSIPPAPGVYEVRAAADLLCSARCPVIIAGGGTRDAAHQVRILAEHLGAAVITTGNARGLLPEDHPLSLGTLLPFEPILAYLAQADAVLAVGTKFAETDLIYTGASLSLPGNVIRIDIDAEQAHSEPHSALAIVADAALVCESLSNEVARRDHPARRETPTEVSSLRRAVEPARRDSGMSEWLDALASELPDKTVVAVDSTQLGYAAQHFLPWSNHRKWLAPYGFGTLGVALPMALGAAIGDPDHPAVAIAGDGGSLFTIAELATAVDLERNLTLVIWDNAGYAEIRDSFTRADIEPVGVATTAYDLTAIAAGFGARATRVTDPDQMARALHAELTAPYLSVIVADVRSTTATNHLEDNP